jgi:hypothetical protein
VLIPVAEGGLRARIFQHFNVVQETMQDNGDWLMVLEGNQADVAWLNRQSDFSSSMAD